jgi:anti-sigma factor RsiW
MGRIIRLHDDNHWELQSLLPWYVTGRLEPAEHARVQAHVAGCEECQEELRFEQALADNLKTLPMDADVSWRRMERRLRAEPKRQRANLLTSPWTGWAVAACALIGVGVTVMPRAPAAPAAPYHVLGAPRTTTPGNMVVIFRPETRERDIRVALDKAGARIVDGPTAADAYVLTTPDADRAGALAKLRATPTVVMAEPVDPVAGP